MSKQILLTQGKFALVSDKDFEWLNQWKWFAHKDPKRARISYYAVRNSSTFYVDGKAKRAMLYMGREILGLNYGDEREVDYINHDTLDHRRKNIRICTNQENCRNKRGDITSTSKFKGVSWKEEYKRWIAQIRIGGRGVHLGYFKDEEEAALAYNQMAIKHFGEFAYINPI
ncbi:MAG TPA: endonuclease [bacterium]|nr:endonuclease [bacterium]